jgi:hypothetical protein
MFKLNYTVENYLHIDVILISNKIYKYIYKVLIYATFRITVS